MVDPQVFLGIHDRESKLKNIDLNETHAGRSRITVSVDSQHGAHLNKFVIGPPSLALSK